jgi:divalent metal cation (Fe/Co/Zn/Cd) transporter
MVHFSTPNVLSSLPHLPDFLPTHAHSHDIALDEHGAVLDPNAAWIALLSVGVKEWMYRLTKRVGEDENSSVLMANVRRLLAAKL